MQVETDAVSSCDWLGKIFFFNVIYSGFGFSLCLHFETRQKKLSAEKIQTSKGAFGWIVCNISIPL